MIGLGLGLQNSGLGPVDGSASVNAVTFHFTLTLMPVRVGDLVYRHGDEAVFLDERTMIVGPLSRMTIDGAGRRVMDFEQTDPQRDRTWPIHFVK